MRWQMALAALPLMSAGALAADIKGASKIDQVTVFPSGAEVTRLAKVKVERGDHVLLFTDLPARALPGSIRVEGKATGGRLAIASVDTRRTFVPRDDAAAAAGERKRLEDAIEKLNDERAQLLGTIEALEAQKTFIANLAKMPGQGPVLGAQPAQQPDWEKLLGFIGQRHGEAQKSILDTQLKVREVDRQIKDLQGKLAALVPRQDERTEVKIFVNAGATLDADLTIRYQVGNASWTPYYDARLSTGTKAQAPKLGFERRASIQQLTGESWDDVLLSLSTTRPGSSTAAPDLPTQTIDYVPDTPPPPPRPAPMAQRSVGVPGAAPATAKLGAGLDEERTRAAEPVAAEEVRTSVDAQGYQAVYGIASRVSVAATGEAKRVQIDANDFDPALVVRTVPKRDTTAFLYAKATLTKGTPVLPGPVSLFRDGTFVGTGQLPLLPPGEEYEMGFGADDAVRVKYAITEEKRGETGLISSSKTDVRSWRIAVKNLRERTIPVTVIDQIPVSQNQDVKVEFSGKTQPTKRDVDDKRGVLAWDLDLKPDEEKTIEFGYRATWPAAKRVQYGN